MRYSLILLLCLSACTLPDFLAHSDIRIGGRQVHQPRQQVQVQDAVEVPMDDPCQPNSHMDSNGNCVCDTGYRETAGKCVEFHKECVFDKDCSRTGVDSECQGLYKKKVYRCDILTYTCIGGYGRAAEVIDCREDFGENATCYHGLCRP